MRTGESVAPHTGAWIETLSILTIYTPLAVAPHTGAWIETRDGLGWFLRNRVAPHTGAWIETGIYQLSPKAYSSHPTRVRGLKHIPPQLKPV